MKSLNEYFSAGPYIIVSLYSKAGRKNFLNPKEQQCDKKFKVNDAVVDFGYFGCIGKNCESRTIETYKINKYTGSIIVI